MFGNDPIHLVQAIVGAGLSGESALETEALPKGCVVALSRSFGSGGRETGELLAKRLKVSFFDKQILEAVAQDARVSKFLMERLDEQVQPAMTDWAYAAITGKSAFREDYRRHLVNVILGISKSGGVILGRGAHLILDPRTAYRVRIVGSLDVCAKRIAGRDGMSLEDASKLVQKMNRERADYIRALYRHELEDTERFDLVINSDRYNAGQMVDLILLAMQQAGFPAPAGA